MIPPQIKDLNIIPLKPNSKIPAIPWKKYQTRRYEGGFAPGMNFALVCGKTSDMAFVLDIDHWEVYERFFKDVNTLTWRTPSGGVHMVFKSATPVKKVVKYRGFPIDIQGEGSYAVCPPSVVDGREYIVIKDKNIMRLKDPLRLIQKRVPAQKGRRIKKEWQKTVEEIKRKADISEVIEEYVSKDRVGKGYWQSLCPFHSENRPSFTVYEDSFYCFGCGASGDVIKFLQDYLDIEFLEAIKILGERYGVELPGWRPGGKSGKPDPHYLAEHIKDKYAVYTFKDTDETFIYDPQENLWVKSACHVVREEALNMWGSKSTKHYEREALNALQNRSFVWEKNVAKLPIHLIPLQNGLFDINTGELLPHTSDYFYTTKLAVIYDKKASCPQIKKFIGEIFYAEDINVVQELLGYLFLRDYRFHVAGALIGSGANGKSTFLEMVKRLLGEENVATVTLQELCEDKFARAFLFGKHANICYDLPATSLADTSIFKGLTGNDTITAQFKYGHFFQFKNHAKLLFGMNQRPNTPDDSEAYHSRWINLKMDAYFPPEKREPNLLDKLTTQDELSGLFNWSIEGLNRLLEQGGFSDYRETMFGDLSLN